MISYRNKKYEIKVEDEDGELAIGYDGKWFRSFEDFCQKAMIGKNSITSMYDEIRVEGV